MELYLKQFIVFIIFIVYESILELIKVFLFMS